MQINLKFRDCRLVFFFLFGMFRVTQVGAGEIREPVWAGSFYPDTPAALVEVIESYRQKAAKTALELPRESRLRALVMPHAGYLYSGWTAAHVSRVLSRGDFGKVVLLGPDHRVGFRDGAISSADSYRTPLGLVRLHADAARLRKVKSFRPVPASDQAEHALEVVLPFLQHFLGSFELVPVVLGPSEPMAMATALAPLLNQQALLVVSSDLSHYLPYDQAVLQDHRTIGQLLNLDATALAVGGNRACGREALLILLELARRYNWRPFLLHYANSGDTSGERDRVVGYAALAFYQGEESKMMDNADIIEAAQGQFLVQLARQTIRERLKQPVEQQQAVVLALALKNPIFEQKRGVFVTLHKHGQLRGCIGSLTGQHRIVDGVREHAINAAFNDYRFRPVTGDEINDLEIEVSILTAPRRLEYSGADDLLRRLRSGVDGVIIRQGGASATFLPQVWEQLPDPAEFLSHLCQKAGLSPNEWRGGLLEVQTYQVQYFAEGK